MVVVGGHPERANCGVVGAPKVRTSRAVRDLRVAKGQEEMPFQAVCANMYDLLRAVPPSLKAGTNHESYCARSTIVDRHASHPFWLPVSGFRLVV